MRTGRPEELPRGLVRHTEPLVEFLRRPYTEENPYYLFQHDLLEVNYQKTHLSFWGVPYMYVCPEPVLVK